MNIKRMRTPALVIGAIVVTASIAGAAGAAAAVHYLVAGGTTYTTTTTTLLDRTTGNIPLSLRASGVQTPPLAVNTSAKVARFNGDLLDGLDSSAFARTAGKTGIIAAADKGAVCPAGTVATGGGGDLFHFDPAAPSDTTKWVYDVPVNYSGPDVNSTGAPIPNSWIVLPPDGSTNVGIDSFVACYNPKGAVPGAISAAAATKLTAEALLQRKAALAR